MKCCEYDYDIDKNAMAFTPEDAIFFDIETTGLKRSSSLITVIGCSYYEDGSLHTIQWFNDDGVSEESMLKEFLHFVDEHKGTIITFNGDNFDLPFIREHFGYHGISDSVLNQCDSLDLYKKLRGYALIFHMEKSTQKAWEYFLGINREDKYDGGKLISVYRSYLQKKNENERDLILLHNREDIRYLSSLPSVLSYEQLINHSFRIRNMSETFYGDTTALDILLQTDHVLPRMITLKNEAGCILSDSDHLDQVHVIIPVTDEKMYHFYEDYRNYFYIVSEDRAIHKSVGCYVDKENRVKCTRENCYICAESVFLPLPLKKKVHGFCIDPNCICLPVYKKTYQSKENYINFDDLFEKGEITENAKRYLSNFIQAVFLREIKK